MERATRADVARAAGVAPSTVSLVLNGRGRDVKIAPATIDRVKQAAQDLNYIPNAAARSLRRGKSHLIALLMAELPDDPFVPVVHTVLTTAMIDIQRRGYLLLPLFQVGDGASDAEVIRGVLGDTQLAGIIRETTSAEAFTSRLLTNLGIPVVAMSMIEADPTGSESSLIRIDEGAGVHDIISSCALVDPNTGIGPGRLPRRPQHQPRSPTPHRTRLRHQLHLLFPARLGTRHRLPGHPSPPDREPRHLSHRRCRRLAGTRRLPGRRRPRPVSPRRPVHPRIRQPGPPQRRGPGADHRRLAPHRHDVSRRRLHHQRHRRTPAHRFPPPRLPGRHRGSHPGLVPGDPRGHDPHAPGMAGIGRPTALTRPPTPAAFPRSSADYHVSTRTYLSPFPAFEQRFFSH